MSPREVLQKVGAPLAGAGAILGGIFAIGLNPVLSVGAGLVIWGAGHFALRRPPPKALPPSTDDRRDREIARAEQRLAAIRAQATRIPDAALSGDLNGIADAAVQLIAEVRRDPADFIRLRKPLVHYLEHTEVIGERLAQLAHTTDADDALFEKARDTLSDLRDLFGEYTKRMTANERLDLDTRIAVLEADIAAEGVPEIAQRRLERGKEKKQP